MTAIEIIYSEALRATERLDSDVDELRNRTGPVLTAAALVVAALNYVGLSGRSVSAAGWVSVGAFLTMMAILVWLLCPITGWRRDIDPRIMLDDENSYSVAESQRFLATVHGENAEHNRRMLARQYFLFKLALALLAVSVSAALIQAATRR